VRRDLVLLVSRLIRADAPAGAQAAPPKHLNDADLQVTRHQVQALAAEYQELRDTMLPGDARTRRMEVVASRLRTLAQSLTALLPELTESEYAGKRLAAVCALQGIPDRMYLPWLVARISIERPFVGYHAALALLAAAQELPTSQLDFVVDAVSEAEAVSARLRRDTDRALTLGYARDELERRRWPVD
jgi:hypothetical protein